MPRCIECHENYSDQLRRCPYCGASPSDSPVDGGGGKARTLWPQEAKQRRQRRIVGVAAALAVLSVAAVVFWPAPEPELINHSTTVRPTRRPVRPSRPAAEVGVKAVAPGHEFEITTVRHFQDGLVVEGKCSPLGVTRVWVNQRIATLLPEGNGFQIFLDRVPEKLVVEAINIDSKRARLEAPVPADEREPITARLWSHGDGETWNERKVTVRIGPSPDRAKAVTIDLDRVVNRISAQGAEFTLYYAPEGLSFHRLTREGMVCFLRDRDGQEVVLVPGGLGRRGHGDKPPHGPTHLVELSPFLIDRTEITGAQYARFLAEVNSGGADSVRHVDDSGGSLAPSGWEGDACPAGQEHLPIAGIPWYGAYAYARWVSGELPTEAQWERAAAGPLGQRYPGGDRWVPDNAHFDATGPVAALSMERGRSWFGVLHMGDNVREFCRDRFDPRYLEFAARNDPLGPGSAKHRVVRGGSFRSPTDDMWLQRRDQLAPGVRAEDAGFRVAVRWDVR